MAIATLAEVYNNPKVLHGVVKIRKGTTCKLILESRTYPGVVKIFRHYIQVINHKSSVRDPNYLRIGIKCGEIEQFCETMFPSENAIPEGARMSEGPINKILKSRKSIDDSMQVRIDQETFNTNAVLGFIGVLLASLFIYVCR